MNGKQLQKKALDTFKKLGFHAINLVSAGKNGEPDIVMCAKGRFIGVEIKGEGDRLSKTQISKLVSIQESGGWSYVVKNISDINKIRMDIVYNTPNNVYTKDINDEELLTL